MRLKTAPTLKLFRTVATKFVGLATFVTLSMMTAQAQAADVPPSTDSGAQADRYLNVDQINKLRYEREVLIQLRDEAAAQLSANERKIEILNGVDPGVMKSNILPAAGKGAGAATAAVLLKKFMPQLIAKLPPHLKWVSKYAPAAAGIIVAAYYSWDKKDYKYLIAEFESELKKYLESLPEDGGQEATAPGKRSMGIAFPEQNPAPSEEPQSQATAQVPSADQPITQQRGQSARAPQGLKPGVSQKLDPKDAAPGEVITQEQWPKQSSRELVAKKLAYYDELMKRRADLTEDVFMFNQQIFRLDAKLFPYE